MYRTPSCALVIPSQALSLSLLVVLLLSVVVLLVLCCCCCCCCIAKTNATVCFRPEQKEQAIDLESQHRPKCTSQSHPRPLCGIALFSQGCFVEDCQGPPPTKWSPEPQCLPPQSDTYIIYEPTFAQYSRRIVMLVRHQINPPVMPKQAYTVVVSCKRFSSGDKLIGSAVLRAFS
eukprot:4783741-Amphidinium_carterae.1